MTNYVDFNALTIIESLRSGDKKTGALLYKRLRQHSFVTTGKISLCLHQPSTPRELLDLLAQAKSDLASMGTWPIIHLEMHGDKDGIQLSNDACMDWPELRGSLTELNVLMKNHLVLTLGVCRGAHLLRIIRYDQRAPFMGLIASFDELDPTPFVDGFASFYGTLFASQDFAGALKALRAHDLDEYEMKDASQIFAAVYRRYRELHLTEEAAVERIDAIIREGRARLTAEQLRAFDEDAMRAMARRHIVDDDEARRQGSWHQFVMADSDPENVTRFPLPPT